MSKFAVEVLAETEVSAKEAHHPSSGGVDFNVFGAITRRKMEKETRRQCMVRPRWTGSSQHVTQTPRSLSLGPRARLLRTAQSRLAWLAVSDPIGGSPKPNSFISHYLLPTSRPTTP